MKSAFRQVVHNYLIVSSFTYLCSCAIPCVELFAKRHRRWVETRLYIVRKPAPDVTELINTHGGVWLAVEQSHKQVRWSRQTESWCQSGTWLNDRRRLHQTVVLSAWLTAGNWHLHVGLKVLVLMTDLGELTYSWSRTAWWINGGLGCEEVTKLFYTESSNVFHREICHICCCFRKNCKWSNVFLFDSWKSKYVAAR